LLPEAGVASATKVATAVDGLPEGVKITALPGVELPPAAKPVKSAKRKPGRPKAGRLDRPVAQVAPAAGAPAAAVTPEEAAAPRLRTHKPRVIS
jgi:hypothetical protein